MTALLILQFFQPNRTPVVDDASEDIFAVEEAPEHVMQIMQNVCYDCHSNQTDYPWYASVSPISWWLQDHINEGREHLNFSNWSGYVADKKAHKMEEAQEELEEGEMPLPSYTWIHGEAKLDQEEKKALMDWFQSMETKYIQLSGE